MTTSIAMPQLGESITEGTVGRWLKALGERVERDEPLVEVVTDKVNVEVPSPEAGYLVRIVVQEGQTVPVGVEIAVLDSKPGVTGTSPDRTVPAAAASDPSVRSAPAVSVTDSAVAAHPSASAAAAVELVDGQDDGVPRTSPLVRRLAREHGVVLAEITGSGLGGRVTRDDITSHLAQRGITPTTVPHVTNAEDGSGAMTSLPTTAAARPDGNTPSSARDTWQALTPMRRAIAEHMVRSVSTAPHVTMSFEIDVTGIARRREAAQSEFKGREGFELTYLPFVARALCESLREHPILNARFRASEAGEQGILLLGQIHLGIAVGLEGGLLVPVIRNADGLSVAGLARAIRDVATRARGAKLVVDDLRGGTFTLNNTGALGSVSSNPIINDGQAAILTTEAVIRRPVVLNRDGEEAIVVRSIMTSCLTFDHRVLDGLQAGRFMQGLKRRLEAVDSSTSLY